MILKLQELENKNKRKVYQFTKSLNPNNIFFTGMVRKDKIAFSIKISDKSRHMLSAPVYNNRAAFKSKNGLLHGLHNFKLE